MRRRDTQIIFFQQICRTGSIVAGDTYVSKTLYVERSDRGITVSEHPGIVTEDTVDHLSESEREVTGLVFALAGYLVHEVYETVPFMLLDSLEAIDSERIATLVEYVEGFDSYLVVALLPEDAAALDERYKRVTDV